MNMKLNNPRVVQITTDLERAACRSEGETATWTPSRLARAIRRYLQFLELVMQNPYRPVAPTRDIDAIWHLHMLSPVAYHRDCIANFGLVLDHDGGFGKGEGERARLGEVFEDTAARWEATFGSPYVTHGSRSEADMTACWHDCQGRCWHACASKSEGVA